MKSFLKVIIVVFVADFATNASGRALISQKDHEYITKLLSTDMSLNLEQRPKEDLGTAGEIFSNLTANEQDIALELVLIRINQRNTQQLTETIKQKQEQYKAAHLQKIQQLLELREQQKKMNQEALEKKITGWIQATMSLMGNTSNIRQDNKDLPE